MTRHFMLAWAASVLPAALAAAQSQPSAPDASNFALTIYSTADPVMFDPRFPDRDYNLAIERARMPGYGVVRQMRDINLVPGVNIIRLTDVAEGIDPTTVAFEPQADVQGTSVLEQDFEFDMVSNDKLLDKYIGQNITLKFHGQEPATGILLTHDSTSYTLQSAGPDKSVKIVPNAQDPPEVQLPELPSGLVLKPTLVWKIRSAKGGAQRARIGYQTDGLTWRADYRAALNAQGTAVDLSAWVSILNESGMSYPDAHLKLVAGGVKRIQPNATPQQSGGGGGGAGEARPLSERSFFEYHLYTLDRLTSLANNSTKQLELFAPRPGVPVEKSYVYCGVPGDLRVLDAYQRQLTIQPGDGPTRVGVYLTIRNSAKNGLGIPMPAGRVRVYKSDDADGTEEFIGEDVIEHTPVDEKITFRLGDAFDIVGRHTQTDFKIDTKAQWITESIHIAVRNHKAEAAQVRVLEPLMRSANWEITQESDKHEQVDAHTIQWPVEVPAGGEKVIDYTVKYTW